VVCGHQIDDVVNHGGSSEASVQAGSVTSEPVVQVRQTCSTVIHTVGGMVADVLMAGV